MPRGCYPRAEDELPDGEIEIRFQLAKAALRGRFTVDAWAQRTSRPIGTKVEDWAPKASELPTNGEVFPSRRDAHRSRSAKSNQRKRARKATPSQREWVTGATSTRHYGTRAPERLRQTA